MPEERAINGGELNPAIITQDNEFNKFLMTLPENQRQTPESKYYTYKMWKIAGKPKDFNQAVDMGLYHWNNTDKSYHGNSVIYDEESDVYHFLKPKDHSTVQYELDWYNKGVTTDDNGNQYELAGDSKVEWEDFRRNYYLDSSGDDYAYRRRPTLGVSNKARNSIMASLENGVKAALQNKLSSINQSLQEYRVNKFNNGGSSDPIYYDTMEPSVVKAFKSNEDYNRYYGEQFGKQVVNNRDKIANKLGTLVYDVAQFHPILGTALDIADVVTAKEREDALHSAMSTDGRVLPLVDKIGKTSKVGMGTVFGKILQFPDMMFDALKLVEDFNKPISEYSNGGKLSLFDNSFSDGGRILSGEESTESTLSGESIDDTGILDRIKGWFTKSDDSTEEVIDDFEDSTYLTYKGAPNVLRMYLTQNRYGKYNTKSKGVYGDTHYDAVESRYFNITQSMKDKGFSREEINRLAPFLVTQMILEGGYRVNAPGNNFGGMLDPKTREKLEFDTDKEFYSAYLDNLDERWGDEYLGEGNGWRNSKTLKEYADIINREDLNLYSEEKFNEYNRTHPENPAYLYTPVWENNGTGLMSDAKFGGIQDRVNGLIELIKLRQSEFRDLSRSNGWLKSMPLEDIMKMQEQKLSQGGK